MERYEENYGMTRKDKKSGYGWASKRVYDPKTGKTKIKRFRVKPKIEWGKDRRFPQGKGVRLTSRHERKEIIDNTEREIMKKQIATEKAFGLRKGFGLFRTIHPRSPALTTITVNNQKVVIKTPLQLTGIIATPRKRQKFPNPQRRKPFRPKPSLISVGGGKKVRKTQRQLSEIRRRKQFLAQLGIYE